MMTQLKSKLALTAVAAILAACSSTVPLNDKKIEDKKGQTPAQTTGGNAIPTVNPDANRDPLHDPQGVLAKRSIYFDLDQYDVKAEYKSLVQAHAQYLAANPSARIVIQGNTDERGGAEYNLALGQRRADAVRNQMRALGVKETQVETVSFGKEKPKATGSNDAAWAENRRADIVYQ